MKKTKIIELLRTFSTRERTRFGQYVNSPFFNKNEKIKKLADHVFQYAPEFKHEKLDKKIVFEKVYGDRLGYNEFKINNIISDLLQLLYDFMAYNHFEENKQQRWMELMDSLRKQEMYKQFLSIGKKYKKIQENTPTSDSRFFYDEFLYYKQMDAYFLSQSSRQYDKNLQLKNDNIDLFYFAEKLKIACDMTSRNRLVNGDYECKYLSFLLERYEEGKEYFEQYPAISIYYLILQTLTNDYEKDYEIGESYYFQLKSTLYNNLNTFTKTELRNMYNYALNYTVKRMNQGYEPIIVRESLELYSLLIENKIIFENGYLSQQHYKNISILYIVLKEYESAEKFLNHYQQFLPERDARNAYAYNMAYLYQHRKEFKRALQLLHEVEFTDAPYHYSVKTIQLKSYYELNETDSLYALIEAFKVYVHRSKKLPVEHKLAFRNMLKFAKKIYQLRESQELNSSSVFEKEYEKVYTQLKAVKHLAQSSWLFTEIDKMAPEKARAEE